MIHKINKRGQSYTSKIFFFIIIIFILSLIVFLSYFLYIYFPRAPEKLDIEIQQNAPVQLNSEIKQFYPNMKFNHNQISYHLDNNCEEKKKQKMLEAFEELTKKVNIITFYPTTNNPDIDVTCTKEVKEPNSEKHFVAGEGGAKEIIDTGKFNVITNGIILLYENKIKSVECDYPNVQLHELMHIFGFDHLTDKNSLMYPFIESCDQKLDDSIIEKLNKLYSQPNLPDLYFVEVKSTKKGIYLDFSLTIKNSGSIDSENTKLSILDDEELAEEFDLEKFKLGSGISLEIENLKLIRLNPKKITFVIDRENKIKEIDKKNNIAIINL